MTTLQDLRNNHKVFFANSLQGEKYNVRNIGGICYLFVTRYDPYERKQVTKIWRGSSYIPSNELQYVATFYGKDSKYWAIKFVKYAQPTTQFTQDQIRKIESCYVN